MSLLDELFEDVPTEERRDLLSRALALALQRHNGDDPFDAPLLDSIIVELDRRLFAQIDAILHHPRLQALESAWRNLAAAVDRIDFAENIRLELLSCTKEDLLEDFGCSPEVIHSGFYYHVYAQALGVLGGQPYGLLCADFEFSPSAEDVGLLRQCAAVAAMAHAPFIANASPSFFNLENCAGLPRVRDLHAAFESPRFRLWHAFRATEDARYVALCAPRVLLREPYDVHQETSAPLTYREHIREHDDLLWGHASFLVASIAASSFARHRWCVHLLGTRASEVTAHGQVLWDYPSLPRLWQRIPIEAQISARLAHSLAEEGFIALIYERGTARTTILDAPSVQRPKTYAREEQRINEHLGAQLPYVFLVSRLAHYIKCVQREQIGLWLDRAALERELERWLRRYVSEQPDAQWEVRARRPLRRATVNVETVEGKAGWYRCRLQLEPHLTHNSASFTLSLVGKLDRPSDHT